MNKIITDGKHTYEIVGPKEENHHEVQERVYEAAKAIVELCSNPVEKRIACIRALRVGSQTTGDSLTLLEAKDAVDAVLSELPNKTFLGQEVIVLTHRITGEKREVIRVPRGEFAWCYGTEDNPERATYGAISQCCSYVDTTTRKVEAWDEEEVVRRKYEGI